MFESIFNRPSSSGDAKVNTGLDEMDTLPEKLRANAGILSAQEKDTIVSMLSLGQHHLFASWDPPGTNDEQKHALIRQIQDLERNCGGGIGGYIQRARKLLNASRAGENPFEGWTPSVPSGVDLTPYTPEYEKYEQLGIPELGTCGFILVAGGLGERLGYHGIKIELPVETVTRTCYLNHYCKQILAIQARYSAPNFKIPFAIMVSDDTAEKTTQLLERNNYFGLEKSQVTLLKQGKVPALMSNQAHIALASPYEIDAKPHGHGDVHYLMHTSGTAQKWLESGAKWVIFFQDTNGLGLFPLPAMLGVSVELDLEVNSLAVPRFAKQSVGAITKLTHKDGREMTINVEYNQLDPLLRTTILPDGDVNDPHSGHSPFPGNINQLLFKLHPYTVALNQSNGIMPEFVNPKYKDSTKTSFKKPTRLECMMQDYPKLLPSGAKVGFTKAPAWLCYSPCKNNSADAAASIASGVPAASPYTAECDQYGVFAELLRLLGAQVESAPPKAILGITGVPSPRIIFDPSFALFPHEIASKVASASKIHVSANSTLVVEGNVEINSLYLDGSLHVKGDDRSEIIVKVSSANEVVNAGHRLKLIDSTENNEQLVEADTMRGYLIVKEEIKVVSSEDLIGSTSSTNLFKYIFNGKSLIEADAYEEEDSSKDLPPGESKSDSWVPCISGCM